MEKIIQINIPTRTLDTNGRAKKKSDLRYALYQAAISSSVHSNEFISYHTKNIRGREREKGINTKMRVKLAAKLLIIAWTLMKKKEPFDPGRLSGVDKAA